MNAAALVLTDLQVDFDVPGGRVSAVDRVTLSVRPGEVVGLVG